MSQSENSILNFDLETSSLRGRVVCLGHVLDDILRPHTAYPVSLASLLAQAIVLNLLLSSIFKFDGIVTLQAKGEGAVKLLVSDVTSQGDVRGCASFDPALVAEMDLDNAAQDLQAYLGQGYIIYTVEHGHQRERYQGIVEIAGRNLAECVEHYFCQSEQIQTAIKLAVSKQPDGHWYARAIMLQQLPEESENISGEEYRRVEDWRRNMILLASCTNQELLDKNLSTHDLLLRLFHEENIRVFDHITVQKKCRCGLEKICAILESLPETDLLDLQIEGKITMKCEFCNEEYVQTYADILQRRAVSVKR